MKFLLKYLFYHLRRILVSTSGGNDFFHQGSWQYSSPKASFGAYYAVFTSQVRYMAEYTPTVTDAQAQALNTAMSNAYLGKAESTTPRFKPELITH